MIPIPVILLVFAFTWYEEAKYRQAVIVRLDHQRDRAISAHVRLDRHILRPEENEITP